MKKILHSKSVRNFWQAKKMVNAAQAKRVLKTFA